MSSCAQNKIDNININNKIFTVLAGTIKIGPPFYTSCLTPLAKTNVYGQPRCFSDIASAPKVFSFKLECPAHLASTR